MGIELVIHDEPGTGRTERGNSDTQTKDVRSRATEEKEEVVQGLSLEKDKGTGRYKREGVRTRRPMHQIWRDRIRHSGTEVSGQLVYQLLRIRSPVNERTR